MPCVAAVSLGFSELRQITEAWLLTTEPYCEIANRLGTDEKTIDYFEKLFFNVRDRLHARDWIAKIIWGSPTDRAGNKDGVMTENQRGILYRWIGHCGGPLVLDSMVAALAPGAIPQQLEDVDPWFDDALAQSIRTRVIAAAQLLDVNKKNALQLIKLALRQIRAAKRTAGTSPNAGDDHAKKILEAFEHDYYQQIFRPK